MGGLLGCVDGQGEGARAVAPVTGEQYRGALQLSDLLNLGINDALAYLIMGEGHVDEIYSFDQHYDNLPQVKRITF